MKPKRLKDKYNVNQLKQSKRNKIYYINKTKFMKKHLRSMLTMLCMVALGVVGANAQTTCKSFDQDFTLVYSGFDEAKTDGWFNYTGGPKALTATIDPSTGGETSAKITGVNVKKGNSKKAADFYVSNVTSATFYGQSGKSSEERHLVVTATPDGGTAVSQSGASTANTVAVTLTNLDPTQKYKIDVTGTDAKEEGGADVYFFGAKFIANVTADPILFVSPEDLTFALTSTENTQTQTFTLTGRNLTSLAGQSGSIALEDSKVAGFTISPSTFTIGTDGSLSQEVNVTYASDVDVAEATTNIVASLGTLTKSLPVTYSAQITHVTETPVITPSNYFYGESGEVTITSEAGAKIYYTTDGTDPTTNSTEYTAPFTITETTTVKAIAQLEGAAISEVASQVIIQVPTGTAILSNFTRDGMTKYPEDDASTITLSGSEYNSDGGINSIKFRTNNSFTLANPDKNIVKVEFIQKGGGTSGSFTGDTGSFDKMTWTGNAKSITFTNNSGNKYIQQLNITYGSGETTETATITSAGYATYVTKNIVDLSSNTGVKAFTAKYDAASSTITLTPTTATVPAGTALVLKGAEGSYDFTVGATAEEVANNDLKATTEPLTADGSQWILAKLGDQVGFAPATPGTTIPAGKAYLVIKGSASSKGFIGISDGDATGINQISAAQNTLNENAPMFNLAGQQVTKAYKGVILQNGKKFINK